MKPYTTYQISYSEAVQMAEKRAKVKIEFYWHVASYVVVNSFLFGIYLLTNLVDGGGLGYPWFIWPLAGWGVGLLFNFLAVYVFPDSPASRRRMVEKEMELMGVTPLAYPYNQPPVQETYDPTVPPTPVYTEKEPAGVK